MLVILPYHSGDKTQAVALAQWIAELGGVKDHDCLLCASIDTSFEGVIEPLKQSFKSVESIWYQNKQSRGSGIMAHATPANAMFRQCAWHVFYKQQVPFLWLEPDATPTRASWLDEIEQDHLIGGKPFTGARGASVKVEMMNGVGVWPAKVCEYAPLALMAGECPFDLNAAKEMMKAGVNFSPLFQHVYLIDGQPPTFPKNQAILKPETALFHRCKNSSLVEVLRGTSVVTKEPLCPITTETVYVSPRLSSETSETQTAPSTDTKLPKVKRSKAELKKMRQEQAARMRAIKEKKKNDTSVGLNAGSSVPTCSSRPGHAQPLNGQIEPWKSHVKSASEVLVHAKRLKEFCTAPKHIHRVREILREQGVIR